MNVERFTTALLLYRFHKACSESQGIQIGMTPEEQSILAVVSTSDLVAKLAKMLSHSLVAKLKAELNESSSSLQDTLEAMGSLDEKMCQVSIEADEAKKEVAALKAELEAGKANLAKVEGEVVEREKTLFAELEKCPSFIFAYK